MTRSIRSAALLTLLALTYTQSSFAANCSRADIDHYLDRGFTPAQVIELCGNTPVNAAPVEVPATPPAPVVTAPVTPAPAIEPASGIVPVAGLSQDDLFKIKHAIDADTVNITATELNYTRDRCHKFGQEDAIGQKPSACVITETRISRKNLEVLSAVKGIFLLQDAELIVKSDRITRSVKNPEAVTTKNNKRDIFLSEYDTAPAELNIPLKKGFEEPKIARLIKKLAIQ